MLVMPSIVNCFDYRDLLCCVLKANPFL